MKKNYILFLLFIIHSSFFTFHCIAQQGQWVWMNGDSTANNQGIYGTQGVYAPNNTPPALYEACEWTDKQGNFWLFGGQDSTQAQAYSDLWEFNPSINQWRWVKGPGFINQQGNYGTQMIASPTNNPGARIYGMFSWVDTAGRLWMFGGFGYDINANFNEESDLWMFNIPTNEWTWMKGPAAGGNTGTWGTKTVEAASNNPPCRCEASTAWADDNNYLWLFGGDNSAVGAYSDLWRFNIATNNWTWMKGPSTANAAAVYGAKGVEAPTNNPNGRWAFGSWKDHNGNFYFFGGTNGTQFNAKTYNDMWRFNPGTNNWTWISGTNLADDTGHVGPICIASIDYWPASRFENRAHWNRPGDNFQLFGGSGRSITFNDVWTYNVATNAWAWMSGTTLATLPSVYGTEYVPSFTNHPGSRDGSLGWTDNNGNLWLFGGFAADGQMYNEEGKMYNDLWEFIPDSVIVTSAFTATPLQGCNPLTVTFTNNSVNGTNFLWNFGDGDTSSTFNPTHTYTDTGFFTVTLIAINISPCGIGSDTLTEVNYIHVFSAPFASYTPDTTIGCNPFTVNFTNTTTNNPVSFHWIFTNNAGDTSNQTNPTFIFPDTGTYTVTMIAYGANCNDTTHGIVHVISPPVVNLGHDRPICDTIHGVLLNAGNSGDSFLWNNGDTTQFITAFDTGTYFVTITSPIGCTASDTIKLTPPEYPKDSLGPDQKLCYGQTIVLDAHNIGATYLWNTGEYSETIIASSTGNYIVAINYFGCIAMDTVYVSIRPEIYVYLGPDTVMCPGDQMVLDAETGFLTYNWIPGGQTTHSITINEPGTYGLTVTDSNGCPARTSIWVADFCPSDMYIPNAFTPNRNGLNEYFLAYCDNIKEFDMVIFNRWGQQLFESNDITVGWDGTFMGEDVPQGTYIYRVDYKLYDYTELQKHTKVGKVTLIR